MITALCLVAGEAMAEPAIVAVEVAVPLATAEQVEEAITVPIEKAIRTLPRVLGSFSSSTDQRSVVEVAFPQEPTARDVQDVERVVARARGGFRRYTGASKVTVRARSEGWETKPPMQNSSFPARRS